MDALTGQARRRDALSGYTPTARAKLDAYLQAALHTGFKGYAVGSADAPRIAIGFTVRADAATSSQAIRQRLHTWLSDPSQLLGAAHLASLDDARPAYLTADVDLVALHRLAHAPFVSEIQLCAPLAPGRGAPQRAQTASGRRKVPPRSSARRILATIDHGCPFAHQALLDDHGHTRVHAIWDQDPHPDFTSAGNSVPAGYGYGRQVERATLESYMAQARRDGRVDEAACYRLARYDAVRGAVTHGSAVLGLLGARWQSPSLTRDGRPAPNTDALDADLVFVQLPRAVATAPDRGSMERAALDGLRYIADCAPDGADVGVVMDYGTEMGPHDGSSWFERALDALVNELRADRAITLSVVFASSNSHDASRHAQLFHDADSAARRERAASLRWCVPRGSDGPAFAELWFQESSPGAVLELHLPGGAGRALRLRLDRDGLAQWPAKGEPLCVAVCHGLNGQRLLLVRVAPTFALGAVPTAPAGAWTIELTRTSVQACRTVHAYTCWGGQNHALAQRLVTSRFVAPAASPAVRVTGDGSLLGSGCGATSLMAGGYQRWGSLARAPYSGGGAARGGRRATAFPGGAHLGADWLAVTEQSPSLRGLLLPATRSAAWVRLYGTSFAAPQAARRLVAGNLYSVPAPPQPPPPGTVLPRRKEYGEPRVV